MTFRLSSSIGKVGLKWLVVFSVEGDTEEFQAKKTFWTERGAIKWENRLFDTWGDE